MTDTKTKIQESKWALVFEVLPSCVLAGCGMVFAGSILDTVQTWPAFLDHPQLIIMVPALLGLKGNLEMTLASRLSTAAHLGRLNTAEGVSEIAYGNLVLTQIQAIVVGFLAAFFASTLSFTSDWQTISDILFLSCSAVITASCTSLFLGILMVLIILASVRYKINPDNVATPVAASLGDFTTLIVLAGVTFLLQKWSSVSLFVTIIVSYLTLIFLLIAYWRDNCVMKHGLKSGWTPVLSAMIISSFGGLILRKFVRQFDQLAVFQPVINGVGGNLVAVFSSKLSTNLHVYRSLSSGSCRPTLYLLLCITLPVQLIMVFLAHSLPFIVFRATLGFIVAYLSAALLQVFCLLQFALWLVPWLWTRGIDPDNASIPYATALGDLGGTALLTAALSTITSSQLEIAV